MMPRSLVTGAVAALLSVLVGWMLWAFASHDLPSTAQIRRTAANQSDRDRYCEALRTQLGSLPELTREEVDRRLDKRIPGQRPDLRFANLAKEKLDKVVFGAADMQFADLSEASLEEADFANADLRCAKLTLAHGRASFRLAKLSGANLTQADLQKSAFSIASLDRANVTNASLKEADLGGANLSGALLVRTDLEKANFANANLALSDYRPASAPRPVDLLNLYQTFPRALDFSGLSTLRKSLIDLGENTQARSITYMIESWRDDYALSAARRQGCLQAVLTYARVGMRRIGFDWTVAYGVSPSRALIVFAALIVVFAALYWTLIGSPANIGERGLFLIRPKGSLVEDATVMGEAANARVERVHAGFAGTIPAALWFSVLSATRFGYGSFTLASWLGALQPSQDEYRALGLFRFLAGLQGLLSLYLLVLFVVTLFGDPFSLWP